MNIILYDKTFEGLLSLIHDCYVHKTFPDKVFPKGQYQSYLFGKIYEISTETEKAEVVWNEIKKRSSRKNCDLIYRAFLSEMDDIELKIIRFVRQLFESKINTEKNFSDNNTLELHKINFRVQKEAYRIIQFVRFQRTGDNIYFSGIAPDYDVLPLVLNHFRSRFADQKWIIYDTRRDYGYYYDLKSITRVILKEEHFDRLTGSIFEEVMDDEEKLFQLLWANYYHHLNISERKNMKLHLQYLPHRYWKYLPEKRLG